ncbi:Ldh family oxidoreductase [Ancylobacter aquaticus]|nr:Ldh family oxidoreductase [Ancylobacter aquaticus]
MSDAPHRYDADALTAWTAAVFSHWRLPLADAATVAHSLVAANLRGVDTHGATRIPAYIERLRRDLVEPEPKVVVGSAMPFAATVDGGNGMGPVVGQIAMDEALKRADGIGIGVVTARRSNHFGAAAYYALQAVERGCIGLCLSPASKSLAPFGSQEPLFGTNPIAVAIPAGRHAPWVMDMATSVAARGHIRLAVRHGHAIPEGWALDADGHPTTDAERALAGVMLPFAGAKGSALAMLVDILGGVLAGSGFGGSIRNMTEDFDAPQDVGHFFLALKIEGLMPLAEFNARMEQEVAHLKALKPAAGVDEVLYPGEPEAHREQERRAWGIPLSIQVVDALRLLADEVGTPFPPPLREAG